MILSKQKYKEQKEELFNSLHNSCILDILKEKISTTGNVLKNSLIQHIINKQQFIYCEKDDLQKNAVMYKDILQYIKCKEGKTKIDVYVENKCVYCNQTKLCFVISNGQIKYYICPQKKCVDQFGQKFTKDSIQSNVYFSKQNHQDKNFKI